jgi:hypothetical protein
MQVKTKMKYHLSPVRMAIIKQVKVVWMGGGEKGTLMQCCWDYKSVQPLWKTVWKIPI